MANNFKSIAQKETVLSFLMENRTQIKTEEVVAKYPDGFTVVGFDIATISDKAFPVVVISEDDTVFFNGGLVMSKICTEWANAYGGDIEKANEELHACGGVKMRFECGKTKDGTKNITRITII